MIAGLAVGLILLLLAAYRIGFLHGHRVGHEVATGSEAVRLIRVQRRAAEAERKIHEVTQQTMMHLGDLAQRRSEQGAQG